MTGVAIITANCRPGKLNNVESFSIDHLVLLGKGDQEVQFLLCGRHDKTQILPVGMECL